MTHRPLPPAAPRTPEHPLRVWRKGAGLTLECCAAAVGTTRPVWHAWETGKRRPDATFLPRVREFTRGEVGADAFFPSLVLRDGAGAPPQEGRAA